jgi:hypothetical protein
VRIFIINSVQAGPKPKRKRRERRIPCKNRRETRTRAQKEGGRGEHLYKKEERRTPVQKGEENTCTKRRRGEHLYKEEERRTPVQKGEENTCTKRRREHLYKEEERRTPVQKSQTQLTHVVVSSWKSLPGRGYVVEHRGGVSCGESNFFGGR